MEKIKKASLSETIKTEVVCPNDTNPMGILQGGKLVQWMDIAAAVSAQTHAEHICVTAFMDDINFVNPAVVGDIITIRSKVTRAFNTSMEIYVEAYGRSIREKKNKLVSTGYFTFVAIDADSSPTPIIGIKPISKKEIEQFNEAAKRRKKRQKQS